MHVGRSLHFKNGKKAQKNDFVIIASFYGVTNRHSVHNFLFVGNFVFKIKNKINKFSTKDFEHFNINQDSCACFSSLELEFFVYFFC